MSDVLLDGRDLPNLTGVGVVLTSGAQEAAQHVAETLHTPLGSLPWDRAAGSTFPAFLNDITNPTEVLAELRRVATETDGVLAQTVEASYDADEDEYLLSFTHESSDRPVMLTVSVGG